VSVVVGCIFLFLFFFENHISFVTKTAFFPILDLLEYKKTKKKTG